MKKVALFKSESEEYRKAFKENNYEAVFVEPLQFCSVNEAALAGALLRREYGGAALTSPRAVRAAASAWDPRRFQLWSARPVYAVGEATARDIKLCLGLDAVGHTSGNAENLAKIIIDEVPKGSKILFPCGNLRSEILPDRLREAGISVDAITVYETKENDDLKSSLMELSVQDPCCLVFFSPSGCEYIHRQLQTFSNDLSLLPHFAIGNSTAHKIENLGLEIAGVAAKPNAESLVESIHKYFVSL